MPEENVKSNSVTDQLQNLQNHCKQLEKLFYNTLNYLITSNDEISKQLKNVDSNLATRTGENDEEVKLALDSFNMFELNETFNNIQDKFKSQKEEFANLLNTFNTPVAVLLVETPAPAPAVETPKK